MNDLKKWKINGIELELDLEDADTAANYENAFEIMAEEEKQIAKTGKNSDTIKSYCEMFRHMYDNIFGKGTSEKIFKGIKYNSRIYDEIYESFLVYVKIPQNLSDEDIGDIFGGF